jgi:hypothetical protein
VAAAYNEVMANTACMHDLQPELASEVDAYRRSEVQALCIVCGEVAPLLSCPRCHAPLCERHQLDGDARCGSCEAALQAFTTDRKHNPVAAWVFVVGLCAASVAVWITGRLIEAETLDPWWMAAVGLLGGFVPLLVGLYRRHRVKPVFLRERPGRRELALSSDFELVGPQTPTKPVDRLARAGLVCSLLFIFPGMCLLGFAFSLRALTRPQRQRLDGFAYAIAGLAIGAVFCLINLAVFVACLH